MNYATKELTSSLQELTAHTQASDQNRQQIPASIATTDVHLSTEVERFLQEKKEYSLRTRNVHVGTY